YGSRGAAFVVHTDTVDPGAGDPLQEEDERDAFPLHLDHGLGLGLTNHQNEAVHSTLANLLECGDLPLSIGVGDVEDEVKTSFICDPVHAFDDPAVEWLGHIRDDEAYGEDLPADEPLRREIGVIVELACRTQHLFPGRLADPG